MQGCYSNVNYMIWLFSTNDINIIITHDTTKHVTPYANCTTLGTNFHISFVYSKCKANMRRDLLEDLVSFSNNNQGPWRVVGDFNVISKVMEKQGGTPNKLEKSFEFLNFMEDVSVKEACFAGNIFT